MGRQPDARGLCASLYREEARASGRASASPIPPSAPFRFSRSRRSAARSRSTTASPTRPARSSSSAPSSSSPDLPIAYYASTYGVDIDLLTRGAGFGYIGSTITSLIYASFTFIFFAIEAAIMSLALEMCFGIPLFDRLCDQFARRHSAGDARHHLHQPASSSGRSRSGWCCILLPFVFIAVVDSAGFHANGRNLPAAPRRRIGPFNLVLFGAGVDGRVLADRADRRTGRLPALPACQRMQQSRAAGGSPICSAGPGWIVPGILKLLAGSFLAFLALRHMVPLERAAEPTQMYLVAFHYVFSSPSARARVHGRLRHRFADQDQRHQCLCRLDRLVEFLLPADA